MVHHVAQGSPTHGHEHDIIALEQKLAALEATVAGLTGGISLPHTHDDRYPTEAELTQALEGKADSGHGHALPAHGHAIADVTNLQNTLDSKAPVSHTQAISTVTGLQAALDLKANADHTHAGGGSSVWTHALRNADLAKSANIVIADDPLLQFAMLANTKYLFRSIIFFDTSANADFKFRHIGPASPTTLRIARSWQVPGTTVLAGIAVDTAYSAADLPVLGTGATGGVIWMEGIIHNGPNAGSFRFQWAQNTSDAGQTMVRAGSFIEYRTVA